jgi:hypothetical protein
MFSHFCEKPLKIRSFWSSSPGLLFVNPIGILNGSQESAFSTAGMNNGSHDKGGGRFSVGSGNSSKTKIFRRSIIKNFGDFSEMFSKIWYNHLGGFQGELSFAKKSYGPFGEGFPGIVMAIPFPPGDAAEKALRVYLGRMACDVGKLGVRIMFLHLRYEDLLGFEHMDQFPKIHDSHPF